MQCIKAAWCVTTAFCVTTHALLPALALDNRQTVLNKLAGEHLALAAAAQSPPLDPSAAAADLPLR